MARPLVIAMLFAALTTFASAPARAYDDGRDALELFSEPGFRGERRVVYADVGNLAHEGFNDRARSARTRGGVWEVCADRDYFGGCAQIRGEVDDLGRIGMAGRVSSLRKIGEAGWRAGGHGGGPRLTLYEREGLSGRSVRLDGPADQLQRFGFNDAARSLEARGRWIVCEDAYFGPPCREVEDEVFDLRSLGLWARISSARPAEGYGYGYGAPGPGGWAEEFREERPAASGRASAFFPFPGVGAGGLRACPQGYPGDQRCAADTADRFCRRQGYARAGHFIVDRSRDALEDVLCVR